MKFRKNNLIGEAEFIQCKTEAVKNLDFNLLKNTVICIKLSGQPKKMVETKQKIEKKIKTI